MIYYRIKKEENRIRLIEKCIENWALSFFQFLTKINNYSYAYSLSNNDHELSNKIINEFPRHLIKNSHDIKYILSKIFINLGKLDLFYENQGIVSINYQHHRQLIESIISKSINVNNEVVETPIYSKPIFYREDHGALKYIKLDNDIKIELPKSLFNNPTKFVEELELIERDTHEFGKDIDDLFGVPYDFTKVKKYNDLVFKRVDLSRVNFGIEEIVQSERISKLLKGMCDSIFKVQDFVGFIYDQGNIYLVSKFVPNSINLFDCQYYSKEFELIKIFLHEYHVDLEKRNVLVQYLNEKMNVGEEKAFVIIDFETRINV